MSHLGEAYLGLILATFAVFIGSLIHASIGDIRHLPNNRDPDRHHAPSIRH